VVCPSAPEKPRGGKWFWSNPNKNGTYETTIDYECGPYAKFLAPNTTEYYDKTLTTCQWNKTWTKSQLDPCICNIFFLYLALGIFHLKVDVATNRLFCPYYSNILYFKNNNAHHAKMGF
jgi:hypothetical protein